MTTLKEIKKQIAEFKEKYGWVRTFDDIDKCVYDDVIEVNGYPYKIGYAEVSKEERDEIKREPIEWIRFEHYKDLHYIYIYVKENDIRFDVFLYDDDDFWLDYVNEDVIDEMWEAMSRYEAV